MIRQLEADDPVSCFVAVNQCQRVLMDAGLADTPPRREEEPETKPTKDGVATESFQEVGGEVPPRFSVASSR